jgi:Cu2+-exporting ATPase
MHCEGEKVYDKPGDCPVCGMDLVKKKAALPNSKMVYTCPHPEVVQEGPLVYMRNGFSANGTNQKKMKEKVYNDLVRK